MRIDGAGFDLVSPDLDAAIAGLVAALGTEPERWRQGRPGKWTVGQHAAHVGLALGRTANAFEAAEDAWRAGTLPAPPAGRGPLQRLFLALVVARGFMPRGATTADWAVPREPVDRATVLAGLTRDVARHRDLGVRLGASDRDRLWIDNPFRPGWHYRLTEMMRIHAVHTRHHARQIVEIPDGRSDSA